MGIWKLWNRGYPVGGNERLDRVRAAYEAWMDETGVRGDDISWGNYDDDGTSVMALGDDVYMVTTACRGELMQTRYFEGSDSLHRFLTRIIVTLPPKMESGERYELQQSWLRSVKVSTVEEVQLFFEEVRDNRELNFEYEEAFVGLCAIGDDKTREVVERWCVKAIMSGSSGGRAPACWVAAKMRLESCLPALYRELELSGDKTPYEIKYAIQGILGDSAE